MVALPGNDEFTAANAFRLHYPPSGGELLGLSFLHVTPAHAGNTDFQIPTEGKWM